MSIRYKLLILLLLISLVPLLAIGAVIQKDLTKLGEDLAERSENVLIHKASSGLKRIVMDHARVLGRERQLLESTTLFLASKIEGIVYGHSHVRHLTRLSPSKSELEKMAGEYYALHMGKRRELSVDFNTLSLANIRRGQAPVATQEALYEKLLPILGQAKFEAPELILWVEVHLPDGTQLVYPAAAEQSWMSMGMMGQSLHQAAGEELSSTLRWTSPQKDDRTGRTAFRISAPIRDINGRVEGDVSIVIPVDSLLGMEHQVQLFSSNAETFLVRVNASDDSTHIHIVAEEESEERMGGHWAIPEKSAWLKPEDEEQYALAVSALDRQEPMTVGMPYKGNDALWAFAPIDTEGTALMFIVPQSDVVKEAMTAKEYVLNQVGTHNMRMGVAALIVGVLVLLLAPLLSRIFTRNIAVLARAVNSVSKGDFSARATVSGTDEIGQLGEAFNNMVPELQERVALKNALEVAQQVQQSLLPGDEPEFTGTEIGAVSEYCDETGGDYYDYIARDTAEGESLVLAVGDVSGHGIPAALMMASARAYLHSQLATDGRLEDITRSVNALLHADMDMSGRFMTMFLLELTGDGDMRWVRAGHDPALLYDPESDSFEELAGEGLPLGVIDDVSFELCRAEAVRTGSIIAIGTDGIWETASASGEMFGKERLKDILRSYAASSPQEIIHRLMTALDTFRGDAEKLDDITIVIIKIV